MSILRSYTGAFQGRQSSAIIELDRHLDAINEKLGNLSISFIDAPGSQTPQVNIPPPASIDVTGIDGKFRWLITNPEDVQSPSVNIMRLRLANGVNNVGRTMLHQVQSATDTNFNNSSSVVDYGVTSQVFGQDQRPNETRFFRWRSSYDGINFNAWQIFSSADTCGPVGVLSGFLRSTSAAPRAIVNGTNNSTVDSVDNGDGTDTIRIYGSGGVGSTFTRFDGQGNQTTMPAGTIGGAAQSTAYVIVWASDTGYRAFPNLTQYTSSLADKFYVIGAITSVAAGGGGGTNGGGGSSGGGDGGDIIPELKR